LSVKFFKNIQLLLVESKSQRQLSCHTAVKLLTVKFNNQFLQMRWT